MADLVLNQEEFSPLMDRLGPFETTPIIAAGVSGGADSMALALLLSEWARAHGGSVVALSVNHGLRPDAEAEALQVGTWMANHGIDHHILTWQGDKPKSGIQSKARVARYALMLEWCAEHGVLHLACGHHADDQIETHIMRLNHDSGDDGLAAMSAIQDKAQAQLLRPLLAIKGKRLKATLEQLGQGWIDDPSNELEKFERIKIRKSLTQGAGDLDINQFAKGRRARDLVSAKILAQCCTFNPMGYALLNRDQFMAHDRRTVVRVLARLIKVIGAQRYQVKRAKLDQAYDALLADETVTLGGCLLRSTAEEIRIYREERNIEMMPIVAAESTVIWDNRFSLTLKWQESLLEGVSIGPVNRESWQRLVERQVGVAGDGIPSFVRYTMPALYHNNEIIQVPHLTYEDPKMHLYPVRIEKIAFQPQEPALNGLFCIA